LLRQVFFTMHWKKICQHLDENYSLKFIPQSSKRIMFLTELLMK
jgi:hypothetical protein